MRRVHRHLILAPLAILVACEGPAPTEPAMASADLSSVMLTAATGSGHYFSGGEQRTFSFSAVEHADGSASGQFEIVIHAIDRYIQASVTCVTVRNDTAWVAGVVTKTNHPAVIPGRVSYFWAVDGGEGAGTEDKVSTARINDAVGEDARFCSITPDEAFSGLPGNVVQRGNVQVH
jgi:hypothetical protein